METLVEYSHRITSGLALIGVLGIFLAGRRLYPKGHLVRKAALASLILMLVEAGIGAGLVLMELVAYNDSALRAVVVALHLVNSLILVAAIGLTAWFATFPETRLQIHSWKNLLQLGAAGCLLLLVGASGAVTALGDTLFPSASLIEGMRQDFSPTAHFLIRLRVMHPVLAILTTLVLLALGLKSYFAEHSRQSVLSAGTMVILVMVQLTVGFANLLLLAPVWLQLLHLLVANFLWLSLLFLIVSELSWAGRTAGLNYSVVTPQPERKVAAAGRRW